jgi:hypothetical protein
MSDYCRTGRTTNQLVRAPQNALFVCRDMAQCQDVKRLAHGMNRDDIRPVPVSWVTERGYWGMPRDTVVVVDHAVSLPYEVREDLRARLDCR